MSVIYGDSLNNYDPDKVKKYNDDLIEKIKNMDDPISDIKFLNHFMVIEKEILSPTYRFLFNNFDSYNNDKQFSLLILIDLFFFTNVTNEINKPDFEFLEFLVSKLILNEKYLNYGLISLHLFIQRFSEYNINLFIGRLKIDYRKQLYDIIIDRITKNEDIDNIQIMGELLDAFNYYSIRDSKTGRLVDNDFFNKLLKDLEFLYKTGKSVKLNEVYQRIESLIDLRLRMVKNLNSSKLKTSNVVSSIDDQSLKEKYFPFLKQKHIFKQEFYKKLYKYILILD